MTTRILLVDDSATVRYKYAALLKSQGMDVDTASDGEEALDKLAPNHAYHLVISDLKMPGLDGHGLVSTIRTTPRLKMLPVLMITSSTEQQDLLDLLEAGVSDYVLKTCDATEFLARVKNLAHMKKLQEDLHRASQTDPLTALFNRRYGVERIEEELSRSRRYNRELSVALIDIDHFKRINDTLGHQAGDEVLMQVAAELRNVSRESDCVIRWGGEEFLFVFPETSLREASWIVERFRQHLVDTPLEVKAAGNTTVSMTVSGGVATREKHDTLESLIDRADNALYRAKENGRNQLLMWMEGELVPVLD